MVTPMPEDILIYLIKPTQTIYNADISSNFNKQLVCQATTLYYFIMGWKVPEWTACCNELRSICWINSWKRQPVLVCMQSGDSLIERTGHEKSVNLILGLVMESAFFFVSFHSPQRGSLSKSYLRLPIDRLLMENYYLWFKVNGSPPNNTKPPFMPRCIIPF